MRPAEPGRGIHVLVVEDNAVNRDMVVRRLSRRGFEVHAVGDGQAALDAVTSRRFEVVLMDLSLPVIDGWEATRRLRAQEATARLPVIALTAHAMLGEQERAVAAGCDAFLTKPIDMGMLTATILEQVAVYRQG